AEATSQDAVRGLAVAGGDLGGLYAVGQLTDTLSDACPAGARPTQDAFVRAYDATTGALRWSRQFGTTDGCDGDADGAVAAVTAPTDAPGADVAGFGAGPPPDQPDVHQGGGAFVRKYDRDGRVAWTREFEPAPATSLAGLAVAITGPGAGGPSVAG